jgi:hypothetical protein
MMKAILVFVDGTICDASHRYPLGIGAPEFYRREEMLRTPPRPECSMPAGTCSTLRTRLHRRAAYLYFACYRGMAGEDGFRRAQFIWETQAERLT